MAGQTLSTFDAVLKEDYEGPIRDVVNREARCFRMFEERDRETQGKNYLIPVNVLGSGSTGARRDGADTPAASRQTYVDSLCRAKFNYGKIEVTGPTIKASRNNVGAFARAIETEMDRMVLDLISELNYQSINDGSGARARINDATPTGSGTTVTVDSLFGLNYPVTTGAIHTSFFRPGMQISCGTARWNPTLHTFDATATFATIVSVDDAANTMVVDTSQAAGNIADNDYVFQRNTETTVANTASNYADHVEMMGLLGIVHDVDTTDFPTNFQNINRVTYPRAWGGSVIGGDYSSAAGTPLSLKDMQLAFDLANRKGRGVIDVLIGEYSMRREYLELVQTDKRYTNTMSLDAGFNEDWRENRGGETTLEFNNKPFIFEKDCPYGTIFFIDRSSIEIISQCEIEWADDDGSILSRVAGKDSWEAFVRVFKNLASDAPNKNTVMRNRVFSMS